MNKVAIWLGVLVISFVIGWLAYKTMPEKSQVSQTKEVYGTDTVSWGGFHRMAEYLNLQDEQRVEFHERERAYRDSIYYYRLLLNDLDARIVQALSASAPDIEQLNGYAYESGHLQERIKRLTIRHFLELQELCTPEQREKLNAMFSQMHQGYGQHKRGQGKGRGMQHGRRNRAPY
jgi:Spy/CpxP family protein refolding chaperone